MTTAPRDDAYLAARLIQFGLRAKARPGQEPEYQELIERYLDRPELRELVASIARGLELQVLEAGPLGVVLAPHDASVFALEPAEFRHAAGTDERLLDGLIQIAIAATLFPRARDLADDPGIARPPTTPAEVDDNLRALCARLGEEARREPDPAAGEEMAGLLEAWRVYEARPAAGETRSGAKSSRSTRRLIEVAFERLVELGCFVRRERGGDGAFEPTWRYQVLVKELAATALFEAVRRLLVSSEERP